MNPTRSIMSMLARVSPPQMFVLILGLAGGTTFFVAHEFNNRPPTEVITQQVVAPKISIVIASRNISEGEMISPEALELRQVEASKAPMDCFADTSEAIGHPAKFSLAAGAPISQHDLAPLIGTMGFQSKLRPGERAITFGVDSNTGVAGFIAPDCHVDVMVQVGNGAETKTRAILSDVRVVASGTVYKKQPGESSAQPTSNVTVAVSPQDSTKLINGMSAGKIYLTLRSDRDHTPVSVSEVNSLFRKTPIIATIPEPIIPPPPASSVQEKLQPVIMQPEEIRQNPMHEVELWQGDKRDVTTVR